LTDSSINFRIYFVSGNEGYISYPKSLCTKGGYKLEEIKKQKRAEVSRSVQDMEISQEEEIRVVKRR